MALASLLIVMKRFVVISIFFLLCTLAGGTVCIAEELSGPSPEEIGFLDLVNEARMSPLARATSLDIDGYSILESLPGYEEVLLQGAPPLFYNERLHAAARNYAEDIAGRGFWSHESPEGETLRIRIGREGYLATVQAELLGRINPAALAVGSDPVMAIFEDIFRSQVRRGSESSLLNPSLSEAGVGFSETADGALIIVFIAASPASEPETEIFELINEARANPLATALSLGLDPETIAAALPGSEDLLRDGLPPLYFNDRLYRAAKSHVADMLDRGYYGSTTPEGVGVNLRVAAEGYVAVRAGESIGMVGFSNFLDPKEAAAVIFRQMFAEELSSPSAAKNILNPDIQEIGIALDMGAWLFEETPLNVHLVACDYGTSPSKQELQLSNLINQARSNPLESAAALGFNADNLIALLPECEGAVSQGLQPLVFNGKLYEAARDHAADMIARGFYNSTDPEGSTAGQRIARTGYVPEGAAESLGRLWTCNPEQSDRYVSRLFGEIFASELDPARGQDRLILNSGIIDVGVGIARGSSPSMAALCGDEVMLAAADGAKPAVAVEQSCISGLVYADANGNGLYDPGEEISGASIGLYACNNNDYTVAEKPLWILKSDDSGGFGISRAVEEENYVLKIVVGGASYTIGNFDCGSNSFVVLNTGFAES